MYPSASNPSIKGIHLPAGHCLGISTTTRDIPSRFPESVGHAWLLAHDHACDILIREPGAYAGAIPY